MMSSGSGGVPPIKQGGLAQAQTVAAIGPSDGPTARPATKAETRDAVDPARAMAKSEGSPRDDSNERVGVERRFVEPDRPASAMLAGPAPTEASLAGPPPTFDLSILEKTRAVAKAPPPVVPPRTPPEVSPADPDGTERARPVDASPPEEPRFAAPPTSPPNAEAATAQPVPTGAPPKPGVPGATD